MKRISKEDLLGAVVWLAWAVTLPLVVFSLGACTMIDHDKVEGWPALTVYEHHVPHHVMRDKCAQYTPWGSFPEACAEFDLAALRCDLYFSADFPPPKFFIEHERMHCAGYDHVGETHMKDFLARVNAARLIAKVAP